MSIRHNLWPVADLLTAFPASRIDLALAQVSRIAAVSCEEVAKLPYRVSDIDRRIAA